MLMFYARYNQNLPIQYTCTQIFSVVKIKNFIGKIVIFFNIFAQNIDCGYMLEPPRWYTPAYPNFTI